VRKKGVVFQRLHVRVEGGSVWNGDRLVGPLKGANAVIEGGQAAESRRLANLGIAIAAVPIAGIIPAIAALRSEGYGGRARVICGNGRGVNVGLSGRADFNSAKDEAAHFNQLAKAANAEAGNT
jgi:hypothetical protein